MADNNIHKLTNGNHQSPQKQVVQLSDSDLAGQIVCKADECNSVHFFTAQRFVVVSQFSPKNTSGENQLAPLPEQWFCAECGHPMDPESIMKVKGGNQDAKP